MTKNKYKKSVDGRDIKIYLSDSQIDLATLIGGGGPRDTSKGIRIALAYYYEHEIADKGSDNGHDLVSALEPKPPTTSATAPDPAAAATPKPAVNILDLPLSFPKPIVYDDDDEEMSLDGMTAAEIEQALAQNRADAERVERKQEAYKAAANGQVALVAPNGANDDDDGYDPYSSENLPESLR